MELKFYGYQEWKELAEFFGKMSADGRYSEKHHVDTDEFLKWLDMAPLEFEKKQDRIDIVFMNMRVGKIIPYFGHQTIDQLYAELMVSAQDIEH